MKFTISRENLQQGLGSVAAASPHAPRSRCCPTSSWKRKTISCAAFRNRPGYRGVRAHRGGNSTRAITAPAKKLQEIAREPPAPVEISTQGDTITMTSGRSRFRLNGLPPDEFPDFPACRSMAASGFQGQQLQQLICT